MRPNDKNSRTNYGRRALVALLGLAPLGLATASLGWGLAHSHTVPLFVRNVSIGLITLAVLVGAHNFFLSWIRPLLLRHKPGYHFVSGIPLVGTLLVTAGILIGFGGVFQAAVGMGVLLLDTGGSVWFLIATWRVAGFWDS